MVKFLARVGSKQKFSGPSSARPGPEKMGSIHLYHSWHIETRACIMPWWWSERAHTLQAAAGINMRDQNKSIVYSYKSKSYNNSSHKSLQEKALQVMFCLLFGREGLTSKIVVTFCKCFCLKEVNALALNHKALHRSTKGQFCTAWIERNEGYLVQASLG